MSVQPPTVIAEIGTFGPTLPAELWNQLFGRLPMYDTVTEPTGIPTNSIYLVVVGFAALAFLYLSYRKRKMNSGGDTGDTPGEDEVEEMDLSAVMDENKQRYGEEESATSVGSEVGPGEHESGKGRVIRDISEEHKSLLAAGGIENDPRHPLVGDQYVQTFYVPAGAFPDAPVDGWLSSVFNTTDVEFDLTQYFELENQNRTQARFRAESNDAEAELREADGATMTKHKKRQEQFNALYDAMDAGTKAFKTSLYITVRADTVDELNDAKAKLKQSLNDENTQLTVKTALGQQLDALQSVSPIGPDVLGTNDPELHRATAMSGAFGATYASFTSPTEVDPKGIEFGRHKETKMPVFEDPWGSDTGNAMFMLAEPGGGKSTTGKALLNRLLTQRDDVIGVVIEPMGNWEGLAKCHGAEHITVGGDKGINPLEINAIPEERWSELSDDEDPLGQTISSAVAFLENYFNTRGVGDQFAEHRTLCEEAITDAFYDAGITKDLSTHANTSPTFRDVRHGQLKPRMENPEEYADSDESIEAIKKSASWLYQEFGSFDVRGGESDERSGRYENFGRETNFDIRGEDLVYLDLGQSEGNVSQKAVLTMHILLEKVYEMAKETDKKVVVAMDEFRYFIRDVANIHSIETLFRHHRHHDIAPWIMTQTAHEFFQRSESEAILDACAFTLAQKYSKMDQESAEQLGFLPQHHRFITNEAQAGDAERGYADGLISVDDEFRKLEIVLRDTELAMSEWDSSDPLHDLPGYTRSDTKARSGSTTSQSAQSGTSGYGAAEVSTDGGRK
ncbi:VirB4 family type IV secretion system protein [Halorubrum pallidum]|uniref:VirB4 family type IV secretion system protein n=1 Tax=Halorubrum pallidum TaxID=1526114 RepID=A0ABD5SYK7_9EURY